MCCPFGGNVVATRVNVSVPVGALRRAKQQSTEGRRERFRAGSHRRATRHSAAPVASELTMNRPLSRPTVPKERSLAKVRMSRALPGVAQAPAATKTVAAESGDLSLPHERDERVSMTGGLPSARVRQVARDVKRRLVDTSRAPEADAAFQKLKNQR